VEISRTFDPVWEGTIYREGRQLNRAPFDLVVAFLFRYAPPRARETVKVLELGCGAGNNLWFAAREGFTVSGIDGSAAAIDYARKRFAQDALSGDLRVGDFTQLPFPDDAFDLVIDRGALTCTGFRCAAQAIAEARRVLHPGGHLLFTPFSTRHTSFSAGDRDDDGVVRNITDGTLTGVGGICFYTPEDLIAVLGDGWRIVNQEHTETVQTVSGKVAATWSVVAQTTDQSDRAPFPGRIADADRIEVRPADLGDMKQIFSWRNDPFVVARSSSRQIVAWADHEVWFTKALTSGDVQIFIVEMKNTPIGQLRLDRSANDCIMSVYLLEPYTGRGFGVRAIREGCMRGRQTWNTPRVVACVREDNAPGARAFLKAGFRPCQQAALCPERHECFVFEQWDDA